RPNQITKVMLHNSRVKKNKPSYVSITVCRDDDRNITHSLRTLEEYSFKEWLEILDRLKSSRSLAKPQVVELLNNLIERVRRFTSNQSLASDQRPAELPSTSRASSQPSSSRPSTSAPRFIPPPYCFSSLTPTPTNAD